MNYVSSTVFKITFHSASHLSLHHKFRFGPLKGKYTTTKLSEDYDVYKNQSRMANQMVSRVKKESWDKFGVSLEKGGERNGKMLFRISRSLRQENTSGLQWEKGQGWQVVEGKYGDKRKMEGTFL